MAKITINQNSIKKVESSDKKEINRRDFLYTLAKEIIKSNLEKYEQTQTKK